MNEIIIYGITIILVSIFVPVISKYIGKYFPQEKGITEEEIEDRRTTWWRDRATKWDWLVAFSFVAFMGISFLFAALVIFPYLQFLYIKTYKVTVDTAFFIGNPMGYFLQALIIGAIIATLLADIISDVILKLVKKISGREPEYYLPMMAGKENWANIDTKKTKKYFLWLFVFSLLATLPGLDDYILVTKSGIIKNGFLQINEKGYSYKNMITIKEIGLPQTKPRVTDFLILTSDGLEWNTTNSICYEKGVDFNSWSIMAYVRKPVAEKAVKYISDKSGIKISE